MEDYFWDSQIDYLTKSRTVWFNPDYLELLVRSVWKIEKPVSIADFGCGNGFLCGALMPLLPKGSAYTGYDKGAKLTANARTAFAKAPWRTGFVQCDLLEEDIPAQYDIVICQALLMHIPEPERMLRKMIGAALPGGSVICMEPNWNVTNAAMYVDGLDIDKYCNLGLLQKLWNRERETGGADKCIGTKLPSMMHRLGLRNVGVRMNDCVQFVNPFATEDEYERQKEAFLSNGWGREMENKDKYIRSLCQRGVTEEEAQLQYDCEKEINEFVSENMDQLMALMLPTMFISYGTK